MKNLSIAAIIAKNQIQSDEAWLIALKIHVRNPATGSVEEVIRVINNTEITSIKEDEGVENYEPFPFSISMTEQSNELPTLSVSIQDQTQVVQGYMERFGGGIGFDVDLIIVRARTASETVSEPELVEYFQVIKSGVANYVVNWSLGAENPLRQIFPGRRQDSEQCGFKYKNADCGYIGPASFCDLTLDGPNGCRAKNNSRNFGGYPGIIARG